MIRIYAPPVTRRRPNLRSDLMLAQNIRALLHARKIDDSALAAWCGHRPAWLSKILSGERGIRVKDLGRIADFFGIEVAQLFQYGIAPLLERRKSERRAGVDRRTGVDRRRAHDDTRHGAHSDEVTTHAPARPTIDPGLAVAQRLTKLSEQLEELAATYLARYATALGDAPPDRVGGDPAVRGDERRADTRKIS